MVVMFLFRDYFPARFFFSVKLFVTSGFLINISTLLSTNHRPRKKDYSNIENRKTRPAIIRYLSITHLTSAQKERTKSFFENNTCTSYYIKLFLLSSFLPSTRLNTLGRWSLGLNAALKFYYPCFNQEHRWVKRKANDADFVVQDWIPRKSRRWNNHCALG